MGSRYRRQAASVRAERAVAAALAKAAAEGGLPGRTKKIKKTLTTPQKIRFPQRMDSKALIKNEAGSPVARRRVLKKLAALTNLLVSGRVLCCRAKRSRPSLAPLVQTRLASKPEGRLTSPSARGRCSLSFCRGISTAAAVDDSLKEQRTASRVRLQASPPASSLRTVGCMEDASPWAVHLQAATAWKPKLHRPHQFSFQDRARSGSRGTFECHVTIASEAESLVGVQRWLAPRRRDGTRRPGLNTLRLPRPHGARRRLPESQHGSIGRVTPSDASHLDFIAAVGQAPGANQGPSGKQLVRFHTLRKAAC